METVFHPSTERGFFDHGWLKTWHSFSFGRYYDPRKVQFGALRVLNDDIVAAGVGFGEHPHDNMEIVTIPLSGTVGHKDSTGTDGIISPGEIQIMSAGSGIRHSEMNHDKYQALNLLQIWVLPKELNIAPRYDQKNFGLEGRKGKWQTVVSPEKYASDTMWINQDAWFNLTDLTASQSIDYTIHLDNQGMYLFVIDGQIDVAGKTLSSKDGLGISGVSNISITALTEAKVLLIEVPML